jgi:hypothetical protein
MIRLPGFETDLVAEAFELAMRSAAVVEAFADEEVGAAKSP